MLKKRKETKAIGVRLEESKRKILKTWEDEWNNLPPLENKECDEIFLAFFKDNYDYIQYKKKANKFKNFLWKDLFLLILAVGTIIFLKEAFHFFIIEENSLIVTGTGVVFLIVTLLSAFLIVKWIDVKKYQETWARHSLHKYLLEQEMLRFILNIENYNRVDKKRIFVVAVQKIWEENQKKFTDNMTEKEKDLGNIGLKIGSIKVGNKE